MKRFLYIILLAGLTILSGCRSIKYVPVETVRTETEYKDKLVRDSIYVKDSILMYMKGDTVYRNKWHTEYKDRLIRDTTYINKTDTIRVPYPVEKELSRWQKIKMDIGGLAIGGIILIALIIVGWLVYKWRKK